MTSRPGMLRSCRCRSVRHSPGANCALPAAALRSSLVLIVTSPGLFPMTVTRLPIPWHHLVCAARRPGKAVLVASGPVAGLERVSASIRIVA